MCFICKLDFNCLTENVKHGSKMSNIYLDSRDVFHFPDCAMVWYETVGRHTLTDNGFGSLSSPQSFDFSPSPSLHIKS